ncbi:hypothetical protein CAPTEDRAFT_73858, partial [Capitella teleta]
IILQNAVQQKSAFFMAMTSIVQGIPALFVTLFLGSYSDKVGRKYAIIPPIIGVISKCIAFLLVINFNGSIWWLLVGSFAEGAGGMAYVALLGCVSYIADTTTTENRLFRIAVLEFTTMFSGIIGPVGIGYIIKGWGYFWPFSIVIIGFLVNLVYVIYFVPETITKDPDARFLSTEHVKTTVRIFCYDDGTNRMWKLRVLFLVMLTASAISLEMATMTLFQLNRPLCWDSVMVGYYSATYLAIGTIGGAILAKICKRCLQDSHVALMAGLCVATRLVYTGFVQNSIMMF